MSSFPTGSIRGHSAKMSSQTKRTLAPVRASSASNLDGSMPVMTPFQSLFSLNEDMDTGHWLLDSKWFNALIFGTVLLNTLQLGLEADYPDLTDVWLVCENAVTGIFFLEMLIKLWILRCGYFSDKANFLDMMITLFGVVDCWILGLILGDAIDLQSVSVLRVLRLARLARIAKVASRIKPLVLVLSGLYHALLTTFWVFLVLIIVMYVFAVFCTEYIGHGQVNLYPAYSTDEEVIEEQDALSNFNPHLFFGSMPASMLTLFNIAIGGEWQEIVRPLAIKQPWFVFLFLSYCIVTVWGIMNVIIAIVVDNVMIESKRMDEEENKQRREERRNLLERIQNIMNGMDENGNGFVDAKEFKNAINDNPELYELLNQCSLPAGWTPQELLHMLDNHGDGQLKMDKMTTNVFRLLDGDEDQQICTIQGSLNHLKWLVKQAHKKLEIHMTEMIESIRQLQSPGSAVGASSLDNLAKFKADTEIESSSEEESSSSDSVERDENGQPLTGRALRLKSYKSTDSKADSKETKSKVSKSRFAVATSAEELASVQAAQRTSWTQHEAGTWFVPQSAARTTIEDPFEEPLGAQVGGVLQELTEDIKLSTYKKITAVLDMSVLAMKKSLQRELGLLTKGDMLRSDVLVMEDNADVSWWKARLSAVEDLGAAAVEFGVLTEVASDAEEMSAAVPRTSKATEASLFVKGGRSLQTSRTTGFADERFRTFGNTGDRQGVTSGGVSQKKPGSSQVRRLAPVNHNDVDVQDPEVGSFASIESSVRTPPFSVGSSAGVPPIRVVFNAADGAPRSLPASRESSRGTSLANHMSRENSRSNNAHPEPMLFFGVPLPSTGR